MHLPRHRSQKSVNRLIALAVIPLLGVLSFITVTPHQAEATTPTGPVNDLTASFEYTPEPNSPSPELTLTLTVNRNYNTDKVFGIQVYVIQGNVNSTVWIPTNDFPNPVTWNVTRNSVTTPISVPVVRFNNFMNLGDSSDYENTTNRLNLGDVVTIVIPRGAWTTNAFTDMAVSAVTQRVIPTGTTSADPSTSATFSVVTNPDAPIFINTTLGNGVAGAAFSGDAGATTTGTGPITYSLASGSLPSGLSLNTSTGLVTGTPTATQTRTFTIRATTSDARPLTAIQVYTVQIAAGDTTAPVISGSNSVSVTAPSTAVASYTANEAVSTWGLAGTNAGLFDISSSGVVTFKAASTAGTYSIIVEATDAAGNKGTRAVTVTVEASAGAQPVSPPPSAGAPPPSSAATTAPTKKEAVRKVVPGFAANSTRLTKEMRKEIRAFLRANPGLNQVVCRGFTSAPATPQDRALARDRGKVTCDLIKKLRPEANVTLRSGSHTNKPGVQIRRVQITLR
jgi:hypothetical protein